jgi:hypothetical protein
MFDYADRPEVSEIAIPPLWLDPITGIEIPQWPKENLVWRKAMLEAAEEDKEFQGALYSACSQSLIYWLSAFAFTIREFEIRDGLAVQTEHRETPFIPWPKQRELLIELERGIDKGESLLVDKARDLGATWLVIALLTHRFLFRLRQSLLVISRKEDAVDMLSGLPRNYPYGGGAAETTLLGKVDYLLSRLPKWMLPRHLARKLLHLVNEDNRSRIDGESANATAGSGDRRTALFIDEAAKIDEMESIKRSTKDVTACRIVVSTPNGPGTTFSKWALSGMIKRFTLPWWSHPEKCKGIYTRENQSGRWEIRSPWFDNEEKTRSPIELATEVLCDHIGSGNTFFESGIIEEHKRNFAKPPRFTKDIRFDPKLNDEDVRKALSSCRLESLAIRFSGSWQIWAPLIDGRLDQTKTYSLGVDISKGQGASNSTVSVLCNETGEKVAAYADANIPPYEFAKLVCAACIWVGGRTRRPLLIWENNGDPGLDFGRQVEQTYRYSNVYFDKRVGTLDEKIGKRYGWRSNPEKKAIALGFLRRAYAHGKFINHSAEALDETLTYIQFPSGSIGVAGLLEESESARKTHGDRVIADMLAVWASQDGPRFKRDLVSPTSPRTFGGRFADFKKQKAAEAAKHKIYAWESNCR